MLLRVHSNLNMAILISFFESEVHRLIWPLIQKKRQNLIAAHLLWVLQESQGFLQNTRNIWENMGLKMNLKDPPID